MGLIQEIKILVISIKTVWDRSEKTKYGIDGSDGVGSATSTGEQQSTYRVSLVELIGGRLVTLAVAGKSPEPAQTDGNPCLHKTNNSESL